MLEKNKIYQGDCLELLKELEDDSIDLIVTDPPYNKVYDTKVQSLSNILFKGFIQDLVKELYRVLKPNGSLYLIMGWTEISYFYIALEQIGLIPQNWITWNYTNGIGSRNKYSQRHEDILFFTKGKDFIFNTEKIRVKAVKNIGFRLKSGKKWNPPEAGKKNCEDIWTDINMLNSQDKRRVGHPTQKPVELIERMILASSEAGDLVLDPFIGSGTTAVCCRNLNREFIGIELNKDYIRMCEDRLKQEVLSNSIVPPSNSPTASSLHSENIICVKEENQK